MRHSNCADSKEEIRFIDLFCGIGGFRLAFGEAGLQGG